MSQLQKAGICLLLLGALGLFTSLSLPLSVQADALAQATEAATEEPEPTLIPPPGPGSYTGRETFAGEERSYRIHIPEIYDDATELVSLLIVMHGAGGTANGIEAYTGFTELSDTEGFIVIYPNSTQFGWNDGRHYVDPLAASDDTGYILHIVDYLTSVMNIDTSRVYVTGHSRGAMMALRLICEYPETFAAAASVASTQPEYLLEACSALEVPVPVMFVQGTDDPVVLWPGIPNAYLSMSDTMRFWSSINDCASTPEMTIEPDTDPEDGTFVVSEVYPDCAEDSEVTLYGVYHGGHTWPGRPFDAGINLGLTSMDIDATTLIWDFFQRHVNE
jgi:polyhydroxybutyrate depolymerase